MCNGPLLCPYPLLKLTLMVQYSKKLETQEFEWLFEILRVWWLYPWQKKSPPCPTLCGGYWSFGDNKGLSFAQKLNLSAIILEGDSEIVIKAIRSEDESFSSHGHLIVQAKIFFDFFHYLSLSHICRQGNFVAHNLARYARHASGLIVWMENVPPHLNYVLLAVFCWVFFFFFS